MPETRKYTVVDLFAGVGGLSYGFSRNDRFEIILANEMQKDIAKAYTLNHPSVNMLQGDIKDLSEDILRQAIGNRTVDVVVARRVSRTLRSVNDRWMRGQISSWNTSAFSASYIREPFCSRMSKVF